MERSGNLSRPSERPRRARRAPRRQGRVRSPAAAKRCVRGVTKSMKSSVYPRFDDAVQARGCREERGMTELGVVRRAIKRADRVSVDALARFGAATVHEA